MSQDLHREAFRQGRQTGFAVAAVATSAVAFVSLLGIEKAILAIVLAVLVFRGAAPRPYTRRLAFIAIGLAVLYVLTFAVIMLLFRDKLGELIHLLQQMG